MKKSKTERGFGLVNFTDRYGSKCSIQESSIATESCIWLGVDDPNPQIKAVDAQRLGYPTGGKSVGWVPFQVPDEVLMTTRMHLNKDQAKDLIRVLAKWIESDSL